MRRRGIMLGLLACCLVVDAAAAAPKARRQWVDPPDDLPVATRAPEPPADLHPVSSRDEPPAGSVEVWTPYGPRIDPQSQVITAMPSARSSCTTRTYTVLSGATVQVHAC